MQVLRQIGSLKMIQFMNYTIIFDEETANPAETIQQFVNRVLYNRHTSSDGQWPWVNLTLPLGGEYPEFVAHNDRTHADSYWDLLVNGGDMLV